MTRITQEHVAKMEALILTFEEEGGRSAIIKHTLRDLTALSGFVNVLRDLGITIISSKKSGLSAQDRREFLEFIRSKRARETQS